MRNAYPPNFHDLGMKAKEAAGWRCQGCGARQGEKHPATGSVVQLALCHRNHKPYDVAPGNLIVLCRRCHLNHDRDMHRRMRSRNLARKRGAGSGVLEI